MKTMMKPEIDSPQRPARYRTATSWWQEEPCPGVPWAAPAGRTTLSATLGLAAACMLGCGAETLGPGLLSPDSGTAEGPFTMVPDAASLPRRDGASALDPNHRPSEEICNQLDDDHDGRVDEGCPCDPAVNAGQQSCYTGPVGTRGRGTCRAGIQRCVGDQEFKFWGSCSGEVTPQAEISGDSRDSDCDGELDETTHQPVLDAEPQPDRSAAVYCAESAEAAPGYTYAFTCAPAGCDRQGGLNFRANASSGAANDGLLACFYKLKDSRSSSVEAAVGDSSSLPGYEYVMTCNPHGCDRQGAANYRPPGVQVLASSLVHLFSKNGAPAESDRLLCQTATTTPVGFQYGFSCAATGCDRQGGRNFSGAEIALHCFYR